MARLGAFIGGFIVGAATGFVAGMLSTPKPGRELRHDLAEVSDTLYRKTVYRLENLTEKVAELQKRMAAHKALRDEIHDFTPRLNAAVDKAQAVLEQAKQTTAQSKEMIQDKLGG
jgi:gas vesicle protein